ncbi:hypothetical protein HPB50_027223 [Hyalomma asiaticum]|uniref:Uncharacterized protein n=1 Tax=Hyalomma asiaticum TaxID=266040 RepID=A0ACB7TRH7_HYAAI|nr:hypothetical protein HPB50_027223 [Hyalomma asiaticum]
MEPPLRQDVVTEHLYQTSSACKAEQTAIALALLRSDKEEIYTDSRSALRAVSTGAVCEEVARALEG